MSSASLSRIERLALKLSPVEPRQLMEGLQQSLAKGGSRQPQDLSGIWGNGFPIDFDLDAALAEICDAQKKNSAP